MKAVRLHKEGGTEQLVYEDAPKPQLGAGDALIRVHATGISPAELTWADTYKNCDGSDRLPAIPGPGSHFDWQIAKPFFFLLLINLVGMGMGIHRYWLEGDPQG